MSRGWLPREDMKAWAVPWKLPWMLSGMPRSWLTSCTALTACPRDMPWATLKEVVTAGNWPWRLMTRGPVVSVMRVTAERGTGLPSVPRK